MEWAFITYQFDSVLVLGIQVIRRGLDVVAADREHSAAEERVAADHHVVHGAVEREVAPSVAGRVQDADVAVVER